VRTSDGDRQNVKRIPEASVSLVSLDVSSLIDA